MSDYSESEQWERAKAWLKENGLWIVTGCAIGLGGLYGYRWYEGRQITQAQTASARYEEMIDAFQRNDRPRAMTIVEELNRDYDFTPYANLSTLIAARVQVEQNELDKAAAGLKSVMDGAKDPELGMIARVRLARVQAAQSKYDDALATLAVKEAGEFSTRLAETRGDVLLAKGDRPGALREYLAARAGDNKGRIDTDLLDLKIRDLGGTPPKTPEENAQQDS